MSEIILILVCSAGCFIGGCFYGLNINVRSRVREQILAITADLPINVVVEEVNAETWIARLIGTHEFICQARDYDSLVEALYKRFPDRQIIILISEVEPE